ncbi:hypothetical protein FA13DRAFT_1147900 [Coprinellus micaceus]|uniref:Uncharacterized protein n=1 Tax=Coprinellus micaceus TaxID=71717 RepID=A0A4Y7RI69_COPMI|nr:hypothetical protein FA13DRAFT_1147900 [Coprinellus micaceus]
MVLDDQHDRDEIRTHRCSLASKLDQAYATTEASQGERREEPEGPSELTARQRERDKSANIFWEAIRPSHVSEHFPYDPFSISVPQNLQFHPSRVTMIGQPREREGMARTSLDPHQCSPETLGVQEPGSAVRVSECAASEGNAQLHCCTKFNRVGDCEG